MTVAIAEISRTLIINPKMLLLVPSRIRATAEAELTVVRLSVRVVENTPAAAIPSSRVRVNRMAK